MRPQWSHVTRADACAVVTCHNGGCVRGGKGGCVRGGKGGCVRGGHSDSSNHFHSYFVPFKIFKCVNKKYYITCQLYQAYNDNLKTYCT